VQINCCIWHSVWALSYHIVIFVVLVKIVNIWTSNFMLIITLYFSFYNFVIRVDKYCHFCVIFSWIWFEINSVKQVHLLAKCKLFSFFIEVKNSFLYKPSVAELLSPVVSSDFSLNERAITWLAWSPDLSYSSTSCKPKIVCRSWDMVAGDEKLCTDGEAWKLPAECALLCQSVRISLNCLT